LSRTFGFGQNDVGEVDHIDDAGEFGQHIGRAEHIMSSCRATVVVGFDDVAIAWNGGRPTRPV
jgi:hypothetical protein